MIMSKKLDPKLSPHEINPHLMSLSVVVPAYDAEATLREQLNALKSQDYVGVWEIIVVDNRSHDSTAQIVYEYQQAIPNLRLVPAMEKQGRAYACNVGVRAAKGDAILFCDADDVVAPGWLRALAKALETNDIVAGATEVDKLNETAPWRPAPFASAKKTTLKFLSRFAGANCGVRRSCFEAVGGFSEDIHLYAPCEDIDLAWRLQLHGYTLHDVPDAVVHYRYRGTTKGLWKQMLSYGEAHVYLYKKFSTYGMPRSSIWAALGKYLKLIKRLPLAYRGTPRDKSVWLRTAAVCWGRLKGSLRLHTLYL